VTVHHITVTLIQNLELNEVSLKLIRYIVLALWAWPIFNLMADNALAQNNEPLSAILVGRCAPGIMNSQGLWDCTSLSPVGHSVLEGPIDPEITKLVLSNEPLSELISLIEKRAKENGPRALIDWLGQQGFSVDANNNSYTDKYPYLKSLVGYIRISIRSKGNPLRTSAPSWKEVKASRFCLLWIVICEPANSLGLVIDFTPDGHFRSVSYFFRLAE
jgi:hypothetical protein